MPAKHQNPQSYPYEPNYGVPPGESLKETLDALAITQVDLAERTELSPKHINQIIKGAATISPETALRFERVTGVAARVWTRLEANYQEHLLRLDEKKEITKELGWLEKLPVKELIGRGAIVKHADRADQLREVFRFFGVVSGGAWNRVWIKPQASFRVSKAFEIDPGALAAWLRLGELKAQGTECRDFDRERFKKALEEIRQLTVEAPDVFERRLQELCADSGVVVAIVREITGARASGAARWLSPTRALIQLSGRYHGEDHFWFSFFHEAGHILLHGKRETFIDRNLLDDDDLEKEANEFAQDILVPAEYAVRLGELRTARQIRAFARQIGIAPGIVVGRLQRERHIPYSSRLNHLIRRFKVRS